MATKQHSRIPKFRVHKASGHAYVELSGQRFYLGRHDQPEAQRNYHTRVAEWLASGKQLRLDPNEITIDELMGQFWVYAKNYYRRSDGSPSSEIACIRSALRWLDQLYGTTQAPQFGPVALRVVRQKMIDAGLCRSRAV